MLCIYIYASGRVSSCTKKMRKAIKRYLRGTTRASGHLRIAAFACVCSGPGVCVSAGEISSATTSSYTLSRVARTRLVELQGDRVFDPEGEKPTIGI